MLLNCLKSVTFTLLSLVAIGLGGCASDNSDFIVHSTRSLSFSPERFARGGTVSVLTAAKLRHAYPDEFEAKQQQVIEDGLRAKGFTIVDLPPGADYSIIYVEGIVKGPVDSATDIGGEMLLGRNYSQRAGMMFSSLNPNGTRKEELWNGRASYNSHVVMDWKGTNLELLKALLDKFPQSS